jgi:hypothetical protein
VKGKGGIGSTVHGSTVQGKDRRKPHVFVRSV